jgi:hypothetical protein
MDRAQYPGKGFGTLWAFGRLSALEQACLASFVKQGYELTLFSYAPIEGVPPGVQTADAESVVPLETINRFVFAGRPDLAHGSDLFRYRMIRDRGLVWVDTDLLMLAAGTEPLPHPDVICREEQGGINGAILFVAEPTLADSMIAYAEERMDRELRWGETGPAAIMQAVRRAASPPETYPHTVFYPVEHYDIWKVLLPAHRDESAAKCAEARTLHLFNNIMTTMGYWKELAPPEGSFLHGELDRLGLLSSFRDVYPERVMTQLVENFRFRQNGKALGTRAVLRELIPSVRRTWRHYHK